MGYRPIKYYSPNPGPSFTEASITTSIFTTSLLNNINVYEINVCGSAMSIHNDDVKHNVNVHIDTALNIICVNVTYPYSDDVFQMF